MDRDEALRLLWGGEEGVKKWNGSRDSGEKIPDLSGAVLIRADLSEANLSGAYLSGAYLRVANLRGADLSEANLSEANLSGAYLSEANLSEANLSEANLSGAYLSEANLSGADLSEANLRGAYLSGANLRGAYLSEANLSEANLSGADLSEAKCGGTAVINVDLSEVRGLEEVKHIAPSSIGIDTLFRSHGKIPAAFLRGCGVPERWIEYLPSLMGMLEPIQFYSCFISYSSGDQEFVERLHADLQAKAIRCWFDREDLKIGDKIRQRITEAIRVHDKLMLVLTEHSIASEWVEGEVESALERERREKKTVLFPIRLDDAIMDSPIGWASHIRQTRHIGDFREWKAHDSYQKAFERLLRDLTSEQSTGVKKA